MRTVSMKLTGMIYEIRVEGYLDDLWADWLSGMSLAYTPGGQTILTGRLPDQAALHGVIGKIRDLGIPLISVTRIDQHG